MSNDHPPAPTRSATLATSSVARDSASPSAAIRQRLPQRQSSPNVTQTTKPPLSRRRSSLLSYSSLEDVTTSLRDDIINPSMSRPRTRREDDEVTHWHSTPLAFAILPALGGLLFKNGSAFVTDVLLLTIAAIFMNWSIRLPWDWYYSAQSQRRDVQQEIEETLDDEGDETAVESASSTSGSPKPSAPLDSLLDPETKLEQIHKREQASAELRRLEKLALFATFVLPMLAAYLLHMIRAQLSASSTGLVSDYNLTIFLLAAEIRPTRQLIRLITNRTLYLQRTVTGQDDPLASENNDKYAFTELRSRLSQLETKLADHAIVPQMMSLAQKADVSELSAEVRKRYEPRVEGLERAMRRYEKRSTALTMQIDQRLNSLETRLQDALSLAAVAAQQSRDRGAFMRLLDNTALLILWPLKMIYTLAMSPVHVLGEIYAKVKRMLFGAQPGLSSKRSSTKSSIAKDDRVRDRSAGRKLSR